MVCRRYGDAAEVFYERSYFYIRGENARFPFGSRRSLRQYCFASSPRNSPRPGRTAPAHRAATRASMETEFLAFSQQFTAIVRSQLQQHEKLRQIANLVESDPWCDAECQALCNGIDCDD